MIRSAPATRSSGGHLIWIKLFKNPFGYFALSSSRWIRQKISGLMDFPTLSALKRISATTWKHFYPKIFLVPKIIFVVVTEIFAYSTSKEARCDHKHENIENILTSANTLSAILMSKNNFFQTNRCSMWRWCYDKVSQ